MGTSDFQLNMNFSGESDNVFRKTLDAGDFTVMIETRVPDETVDPKSAVEKLIEMEECVASVQSRIPAALAILENASGKRRFRAVEYAAQLPEEHRNRHIVYLSGSDTTPDDFSDLMRFAQANHIRNLVPITTAIAPGTTVRDCRRRFFIGDAVAVAELKKADRKFFTGAVVNPYQYEFYPLIAQYHALIRKFGQGARFAVAQAGWDMLKLQSLIWYLNTRECYFPVIARLILLSPSKVDEIVAKKYPGIEISPSFSRILDRELRYSRSQFETAQCRRLELQAAGCRLLGCRGIQISGADTPGRAAFLINRIADALQEFTSFSQWIEEYNAYMASAELAAFSHDFTLFDRTLHRNYPLDEIPVPCLPSAEPLRAGEKFRFAFRETAFRNADKRSANHRKLLKMLSVGCPGGCRRCRLPQTHYICPLRCPKRLLNGPCDSILPNGICDVSGNECVHVKIVRAAYRHNEFATIESRFFNSVDE